MSLPDLRDASGGSIWAKKKMDVPMAPRGVVSGRVSALVIKIDG